MTEEEKYKRAQARVRKIKNFYSSVLTFVWVNILLLVINLLTSPHSLWFWWVTIIWAAVLVIQAIKTFIFHDRFLDEDWEERKIRELMDKDKKE